MRLLMLVLSVLSIAPGSLSFPPAPDQSSVPPRDQTAQAPAGAGRLSGRVVAGASKQPLFRAIVQLNSGNLQTARWTMTDAEGRWSFENVPAGSYTLTASRDGYVSMGYGQRGAHGTPAPLVLAQRAVLGNLDISLPRGGVITGRVVDERGEPVAGVLVQPMRIGFADGQRRLVATNVGLSSLTLSGLTDDQGDYRLYGLVPGSYYLSATFGQTPYGRTDDQSTYATTYAPGTALVSEAAAVAVTTTQIATSDITLVRTRLASVSGKVLTAEGMPSRGSVSLGAVAPGYAVEAVANPRLSAPIDPTGGFSIRGVPPGTYYLYAGPTQAGGRGAAPATTSPEAAVVPITVTGVEVRDLVVQTARTASIAVQLRFEQPRAAAGAGLRFRVRTLESGGLGESSAAQPDENGRFLLSRILGRAVLRLEQANVAPGWWLKSVTIDGVDVTDGGYEFRPGADVSAEVIVTQRMGSVTGVVRDSSSKPVADCSVVVFAQDETRWTPFTRFIVASDAKGDGTFLVAGLPAGAYFVVAVPPLEAGEETDPERLKSWRGMAQAISLGDTEAKAVTLRLVP